MRIEFVDGKRIERWLITSTGKIDVSRRNRSADCLLRADRRLFRRLASGEENAFAAVLRGRRDRRGRSEAVRPLPASPAGPPVSPRLAPHDESPCEGALVGTDLARTARALLRARTC
jgi:hypothetical protein